MRANSSGPKPEAQEDAGTTWQGVGSCAAEFIRQHHPRDGAKLRSLPRERAQHLQDDPKGDWKGAVSGRHRADADPRERDGFKGESDYARSLSLFLIAPRHYSRFISPFIRSSSARTQELDLLEEDSSVFKLIGPVLVKQELVEVKNNVTKRVEFIKNDITRLEGTIKKFEKQSETVKGNIAALQKSGKQ